MKVRRRLLLISYRPSMPTIEREAVRGIEDPLRDRNPEKEGMWFKFLTLPASPMATALCDSLL